MKAFMYCWNHGIAFMTNWLRRHHRHNRQCHCHHPHPIFLLSRDVARGKTAIAQLHEVGLGKNVEMVQLDVTDRQSIANLAFYIKTE